jgi:all-trans-retinol 13,14-reductase
MLDTFEKDITKNPMSMFISSSAAKDKSWIENYPSKSNAIILTLAKKEWFEEWENEPCTKRNVEYTELKNILGQRMLNEGLYKYYPKTKGKVTHYEIATPLTNNHYFGRIDGEGYGIKSNSFRYLETELLRPETSIKNLYLTGQDICMLGVCGALGGGILTAHSILGYGTMLDILTKKNLIKDLLKK